MVFGIESGSDTVLAAMNKKATVEDNRRAIHLVKRAGLQCIADMILGFPGETPETIEETKRFLRATRPTAIHMGILTPFPMTKVYLEAKESGALVGDWDQEGVWPYVSLAAFPDFDAVRAELTEIQRGFYTDPRVIASLLLHIAPRMGLRDWRATLGYMRRRLLRPKRK